MDKDNRWGSSFSKKEEMRTNQKREYISTDDSNMMRKIDSTL